MYNIVNLLTEEPKKLERIILLFLKLLVVLFVGGEIFDYQFSMKDATDEIIPQDYTISKGIFFLISLTIVWYLVWTIFADVIIGGLSVWIFSRKPVKRDTFMEILHWFSVVEQKGKGKGKYIVPGKQVIKFQEMLSNYTDEDDDFIEDGKSRLHGYFSISVVIYIVLLSASDLNLPILLIIFGAFMILNMLVLAVVINKAHRYLIDNFDALKKEFGFLAYAEMTKRALEQNQHVSRNFEFGGKWKAIGLKKKFEQSGLPEEIRVYPFYVWNEEFGKEVVEDMIAVRGRETDRFKDRDVHFILISNTEISEKAKEMLELNPKLDYIECEVNEEKIYKRLELLFYRIAKRSRTMIESPEA